MNDEASAHFDRLLEISKAHNASAPFVPYPGDIYTINGVASRFPRVMWCGSATAGWGVGQELPKSYCDAMLMTRYFLLHDLPSTKTGFWHSIFQFSQFIDDQLNLGLGTNLISRSGIIFNNLFKIGSTTGEPKGQLRSSQIEICRDLFFCEIEDHKPEYVVLHVGSLADDIIETIIGSATVGWEKVSPSVWRRDEFGVSFFWVDRKRDEFQGQRGQQVADLVLSNFNPPRLTPQKSD